MGFILVEKKQRSSSLFLKRQFFPYSNTEFSISEFLYIFILIAFYQFGLYQSVTVNQIIFQSSILSVTQGVILICWNSNSLLVSWYFSVEVWKFSILKHSSILSVWIYCKSNYLSVWYSVIIENISFIFPVNEGVCLSNSISLQSRFCQFDSPVKLLETIWSKMHYIIKIRALIIYFNFVKT